MKKVEHSIALVKDSFWGRLLFNWFRVATWLKDEEGHVYKFQSMAEVGAVMRSLNDSHKGYHYFVRTFETNLKTE